MTVIGAPAIAPGAGVVGRRRSGVLGTMVLDGLCGLGAGESSNDCGRVWCGYFDAGSGRCGLLDWDVLGRMGIEGLRWFVEHRETKSISRDDAVLIARSCVL